MSWDMAQFVGGLAVGAVIGWVVRGVAIVVAGAWRKIRRGSL